MRGGRGRGDGLCAQEVNGVERPRKEFSVVDVERGIARVRTGDEAKSPASRPRLALLVDTLDNAYAAPLLDEVIELAHEHGVKVSAFVHWLTEYPSVRNLVTDLPGPHSTDAVLVVALGNLVSLDQITAYCTRYKPLPICTVTVPWSEAPHVLVDNEPGMREEIHHLINVHGRRRIAFVRGPEASSEALLRFRVYRDVLAEHGVELDPRLVSPPGWFDAPSGADHVRRLLDEQVSFDAIACVNDGAAMGALGALKARGLRVPEEVAVVGFDDVEFIQYLESPLTTVRQPTRAQVRQAFLYLLSQITGRPAPAPTPLRTELVIRESCGCSAYLRVAELRTDASLPLTADDELRAAGDQAALNMAQTGKLHGSAARDLCRAFVDELMGGDGSFSEKLETILHDQSLLRGASPSFQECLTVIQHTLADRLQADSVAARRAATALHGARVQISNMGERVPARTQLRFEGLCQNLNRLNRALVTAEDLQATAETLRDHMPGLGVVSCYVCLYEGDRIPAETARLIVAVDSRREINLAEDGIVFRCRDIVPASIFGGDDSLVYIVYPLEQLGVRIADGAQERQKLLSFGYVVFGRDPSLRHNADHPKEGFVYEGLQGQIVSVLRKLKLLERLVDETKRRQEAERAHLEKEVGVARRIQTDILPRDVVVEGLEVSAKSFQAIDHGGVYYDIVPVMGGCWIGAGGVSGRGLPTGLVTLMLQSVVSGLVRTSPDSAPSELASIVDAVLLENTRQRMSHTERAHFTLLRYTADGRVMVSGSHARLFICRADSGQIESAACDGAETPGSTAPDYVYRLAKGDLLVLYGVDMGERRVSQCPRFGRQQLATALAQARTLPVEAIREALIAQVCALESALRQDVILIVARHTGAGRDEEPRR